MSAASTAGVLICGDRTFSRAEHDDRVARLMGALRARGIVDGDRIAILSENCIAYVETYSLAERFANTLVTLNYRLAQAELAYILDHCRPAALIFEARYASIAGALRATRPWIRCGLVIDGTADWATDYESALSDAQPATPDVSEIDDAFIMYTSGTTGRPKGVRLGRHGQRIAARRQAEMLELTVEDRCLVTMPLYHLGGRSIQSGHWNNGATVVIHRSFVPDAVCGTIEAERITTILLAPTMIQMILELSNLGSFDLSSLRTIAYAASPMPTTLLLRATEAFGPLFLQFYGLTETGPSGTMLAKHDHRPNGTPAEVRRLASSGQASPGCAIRVVDDERTDLPTNTPGEILIKSDTMMLGYFEDEAATSQALRDGWLSTGDIGYLDDDGYLFIVERKKDMIVSGGENIYPREVEECLFAHPNIADVAVVGVPDVRWGESVKAFIVLRNGATLTLEDVQAHSRKTLASYKKPTRIAILDALPRSANGKVDKPFLRTL